QSAGSDLQGVARSITLDSRERPAAHQLAGDSLYVELLSRTDRQLVNPAQLQILRDIERFYGAFQAAVVGVLRGLPAIGPGVIHQADRLRPRVSDQHGQAFSEMASGLNLKRVVKRCSEIRPLALIDSLVLRNR